MCSSTCQLALICRSFISLHHLEVVYLGLPLTAVLLKAALGLVFSVLRCARVCVCGCVCMLGIELQTGP